MKRNLKKYIRWYDEAQSLPVPDRIKRMLDLTKRHKHCKLGHCAWMKVLELRYEDELA